MLPTAAILLLAAGCGYTTRGLYPDSIDTVHVPIFRSNGLRRDIEFQLTERVIQLIEARTPFKVVPRERADTILVGSIDNFFKGPFGEDGFDNPRGGIMTLLVTVSWIDNRTGQLIHEGNFKLDNNAINLYAAQSFVIDAGQSVASADADAIEQIADQIVSLMQAPW
jgi:hypothetical protein